MSIPGVLAELQAWSDAEWREYGGRPRWVALSSQFGHRNTANKTLAGLIVIARWRRECEGKPASYGRGLYALMRQRAGVSPGEITRKWNALGMSHRKYYYGAVNADDFRGAADVHAAIGLAKRNGGEEAAERLEKGLKPQFSWFNRRGAAPKPIDNTAAIRTPANSPGPAEGAFVIDSGKLVNANPETASIAERLCSLRAEEPLLSITELVAKVARRFQRTNKSVKNIFYRYIRQAATPGELGLARVDSALTGLSSGGLRLT
jgi:hypothetical protein